MNKISDALKVIQDTYTYVAGDSVLRNRLAEVEDMLRNLSVRMVLDVQNGIAELETEASVDLIVILNFVDDDVEEYYEHKYSEREIYNKEQLLARSESWLAEQKEAYTELQVDDDDEDDDD